MFGGLWIVEFGYQCRHQGHIGVWHESGRACAWGEGGWCMSIVTWPLWDCFILWFGVWFPTLLGCRTWYVCWMGLCVCNSVDNILVPNKFVHCNHCNSLKTYPSIATKMIYLCISSPWVTMANLQQMVVINKFASNSSNYCVDFESSTNKILSPYSFCIRDSNHTYFNANDC